MVDVAPVRACRASEVVEFVPEDSVTAMGRQMKDELCAGDHSQTDPVDWLNAEICHASTLARSCAAFRTAQLRLRTFWSAPQAHGGPKKRR